MKTAPITEPGVDLERVLERVRAALVDYYSREEKEDSVEVDVTRVVKRPFSAVGFLRARTPRNSHRLVMKTTMHHPMNKAITDNNNQAVVEFNILKHLYPRFKDVYKCSVPRPVLVVPEIETYVMDFVEGHLLLEEYRYGRRFSSRKGFSSLQEHYFYCGKWLRHFHEFTGHRMAGPEALTALVERCDHRLSLMEKLRGRRCPSGLRNKVMEFLREQLSQLPGEQIPVSGRHGDFYPGNILAGPQGITVIDFLGYDEGPIAADPLQMLMCLDDERVWLTNNGTRIEALRQSFLEGFGDVPPVPVPVLIVCETMHRILSLGACLFFARTRPHHHIERELRITSHLRWLTKDGPRKLLWPGHCSS